MVQANFREGSPGGRSETTGEGAVFVKQVDVKAVVNTYVHSKRYK